VEKMRLGHHRHGGLLRSGSMEWGIGRGLLPEFVRPTSFEPVLFIACIN
jgi:hypothetical protein